MNEKNAPIGIFDSGVGGLTVLDAFLNLYPFDQHGQSYVYIGDTARLPYGTKSPETIIRYSETIARALTRFKPKAIIVACNTASTYALEAVKGVCGDIPCIGMITPSVQAIVTNSDFKHILVMGTAGTIKSDIYARSIKAEKPKLMVSSVACQLLVALAEENWANTEIARAVIRRYLDPFFHADVPPDCIILGCTHFPVFTNILHELYGAHIVLINTGFEAAKGVRELITQKDDTIPLIDCYVTDNKDRFLSSMNQFLNAHDALKARVNLLDL